MLYTFNIKLHLHIWKLLGMTTRIFQWTGIGTESLKISAQATVLRVRERERYEERERK